MYKFFKQLKLELFYWRKCIFQYHKFWKYLYNKYILAPQVLKLNKILEKPINQPNLSIHILTCHRDLIMALWSLASFYQHSSVIGQLYIHDDGSLTKKDKYYLKKFFPSAKIVGVNDVFINQKDNLISSYPIIKNFRKENALHPFVKKLVDSYFISDKKFHLLFDTDILWFKNPQHIWLQLSEKNPISYMLDNRNVSCYVYFKGHQRLSDKLATFNAGIVFYHQDNFNLAKLQFYLNNIDTQISRNFYFIEQAGHAHCLENLQKLPTQTYIISADLSPATVVKHYTSPRRPLFYIEGIEKLKDKIIYNKI